MSMSCASTEPTASASRAPWSEGILPNMRACGGRSDPDSKVVKQAVAELASLQAEERNTLGKAYDILARIGVRRPEGLEDTQDLEGVLDNDDDDDDKSENDF